MCRRSHDQFRIKELVILQRQPKSLLHPPKHPNTWTQHSKHASNKVYRRYLLDSKPAHHSHSFRYAWPPWPGEQEDKDLNTWGRDSENLDIRIWFVSLTLNQKSFFHKKKWTEKGETLLGWNQDFYRDFSFCCSLLSATSFTFLILDSLPFFFTVFFPNYSSYTLVSCTCKKKKYRV